MIGKPRSRKPGLYTIFFQHTDLEAYSLPTRQATEFFFFFLVQPPPGPSLLLSPTTRPLHNILEDIEKEMTARQKDSKVSAPTPTTTIDQRVI
jgi:hypothetical protein